LLCNWGQDIYTPGYKYIKVERGFYIMECYLGTILPWPVSYAPEGWALCQGQLLPVSQNQALFAILGATYGGDGRNNFALPNLCGRFPIGTGQNPNSGVTYTLGQQGTNSGSVVLKATDVPLLAHTHTIQSTATVTGGGGNIPVSMNVSIPANNEDYTATNPLPTGYTNIPGESCIFTRIKAGNTSTAVYTTKEKNTTLKPFTASANINVPAPTVSVTSACAAAGANPTTPVSVMPPYLCLNYIIATTGYFPARP